MSRLKKYLKYKVEHRSLVEFHRHKNPYPIPESITQKEDQPDWVYLIYNSENRRYKIGITSIVKNRVKELSYQSGSRHLSVIEALHLKYHSDESAAIVEQSLLIYFNKKRYVGEWFILSKRDLCELRQLLFEIGGDAYFSGAELIYWKNNVIPFTLNEP